MLQMGVHLLRRTIPHRLSEATFPACFVPKYRIRRRSLHIITVSCLEVAIITQLERPKKNLYNFEMAAEGDGKEAGQNVSRDASLVSSEGMEDCWD